MPNTPALPRLLRNVSNKKRPTRIGLGIALSFAFTITLMVALTGISLNHLKQADARLKNIKNIVEKNNIKAEMAQIMQRTLRERALSMHIMTNLTDDFLKDEEYQRFYALGGEYSLARAKLEVISNTPEEKKIFFRILNLTREAQPEVEKLMEIGLQGGNPNLFDQIRNKAVPMQRLISEQVDALIRLQQSQPVGAVKDAKSSSVSAFNAVLWIGGITIVLTVLIGMFVTRRVASQAQVLNHQALHDELTGLPNRTLFHDRLEQAIQRAQREEHAFVIILMDLDRFKEVNDTMGHDVGDLLLQEVARRLRNTVRNSDTVARLGGDEYIIILENISQRYVQRVIEKLLKTLDRPFMLEDQAIDISASLGIARYPDHGKTAIALTQRADVAMYAAKQGHSGFAMYSEAQEHSSRATLTLKSELRHAIEHDELVLHYQPKIDHNTGLIMGVEALVRWQHPKRGFLAPDKFISGAEQTGLIGPLTRWVLTKAIFQCAALHKTGIMISMAVNFSARNLHDKHLAFEIATLLERAHLRPDYLILEITESAVMADPVFGLEILNQFDKMGVTLAIDDFGTGYSSLSYLSKLPMNEIKIDKSFVLNMMQDPQASVIVRSTIELGHNLGLKVVAEGVETQEVWDQLTRWGCDTAQGYYMSRPLPEEKLMQWLDESSWSPMTQPFTPATI